MKYPLGCVHCSQVGNLFTGSKSIHAEEIFPITQHEVIPVTEAVIPQKAPFPIKVEAGQDYYWCSCGRSAKQPFCDGSHKGSSFTPVKYTATESSTVYFCGCKHSKNSPLCDGQHSRL